MRGITLLTATFQLLGAATSAVSGGGHAENSDVDSYDYVIVGGGLTGLVVANRLSENKNRTVLVIEAGDDADPFQQRLPYGAMSALNTSLLWDFVSEPEPFLNNGTWPIRVGKAMGGGSLVNGMMYDRGSAADYDAWEALGNSGWGWEGMLPYFKKGVKFIPPPNATVRDFNMTWDPETYGNGPLALGISDFQYPDVKAAFAAWRDAGVHMPIDGNNGEAYGASWYPNTMDPRTGERTHSRNAYYDPVANRTNLHVLLRSVAEEIIFSNSSSIEAQGVKVTAMDSNKTTSIFAKKELILAGGAVQTPKLLQISGIGPKSVLEAAGVKVKHALDAVGANFQDHPYSGVVYNVSNMSFPNPSTMMSNPAWNASAWQEYVDNKTGPYTQARGNSLAFIGMPTVDPKGYAKIVEQIKSLKSDAYLPSIYKNSTRLLKGIEAQRRVLAEFFTREDAAVVENPVPASPSYGMVALQKPLSRGTIALNAEKPNGRPEIQYNALMNPVDKSVMAACVRYLRTVWAGPAFSRFGLVETAPGPQYKTDEEIMAQLVTTNSVTPTLSHPSGSCAMMPEELGGCVSDELQVYGVKGLSIVDASIIPIIPSCHIQATMYGIAEKAAAIIQARA